MKRKLIFCLILIFLVGSISVSAVNPLIFTAINDVIQLAPTPNNVPIRSGSTVYVLPETFTRLLGIKSIYNSNLDKLILYRNDRNIAFDLKNGSAMDESGNTVTAAIRRGGKIYVPAKVVCNKFSLNYSYISASSLGGVVRINDGTPAYDDAFFLEKNAETMRNLYISYNKSYMNSQPEVPDEPDVPIVNNTQTRRNISLAIKCTDGAQIDNMLAQLEARNMKAAIYIDEQTALDGETVRKIYVSGNTLGIMWEGDIAKVENVNSIIRNQTMTKSNMVLFEKADEMSDELEKALNDKGYKAHTVTYNVSGKYQTMVANVKNHISRRTSARLAFGVNEDSVRALENLTSYFRQNNCTVSAVSVFD